MKKNLHKKLALALAAVMTVSSVFSGASVTANAETGYVSVSELTAKETEAPAKDAVVPNANQYRYQKEELAAFCHFGPNTFNEIEWGEHYGDRAPADIFTLSQDFDAETMVKALKDAGFEKLIVTAKHHDGFCIWNSKWTEYDVAASNYKDANGNSDILAEISAACTEYDMDMGLYLSPWDIHDDSYGYYDANGNATNAANDAKDYNEYYNNQLIEILGNDEKYGNNGHFTEVWMDGAKGSGANAQEYDFVTWFNTIQKYEGIEAGYDADCMLFGAEAYTTVRWIGNENGYAAEQTWSKSSANFDNNTVDHNQGGGYTKGFQNGNIWTVPESDARITSGWFWGNTKKTPKTIEDLASMYFGSVGHNSPLLLNIPPNNQGTVDKAILDRVEEFGMNVKETFKKNYADQTAFPEVEIMATTVRGNDVAYSPANLLDGDDSTYWTVDDGTTSGTLLVDLGQTRAFDVVSLEEAILFGQRITNFKVEYKNGDDEWKTFDEGTTIGAKRLCRKATVQADQLRITVSTEKTEGTYVTNRTQQAAAGTVPMLTDIGVYKASEGFELVGAAPVGMEVIDITDSEFTFAGNWTQETGNQYANGTNTWANGNPNGSVSATVNFTGTKAYFIGTFDPNHGKADIYVDDVKVGSIDTNKSPRKVGQILFESPDLSDGEHTMRLVATQSGKAIGLEAAYVVNNGGFGMVGIKDAAYTMHEDSEMEVTLVRVGGTDKEVTVLMSPNPGSAIQDDFDTELNETVTFAAGETEKTATVRTTRNTKETGDQYFTIELSSENDAVILGFNAKAKITILDTEIHGATDEPVVDPADDSMDIPTDQYTATAGSTQSGNSPDRAIDGNENNYWEVAWGEGGRNFNNLWYQIELDEATEIDSLRYLPRYGSNLNGGDANGFITGYRVEVSMNGTDWETAAEGTWQLEAGWKLAQFDEAVTAKFVRLVATSTYAANGNNLEMSICELRVKAAPEVEYNFVFPSEVGESATLEAENYAELYNFEGNDGSGPWPLKVADGTWHGTNMQYLDAMNGKNGGVDYTTYFYNAPVAGTYTVTLTYRSGDPNNTLVWSEADGKITAGSVVAGANDSATANHTKEFEIVVATAGAGTLTLTAPEGQNAPQIDKLDIVLKEKAEVVVPVEKADLAAAIETAEKLEEDAYTAETWEAFAEALEAAKAVNEDAAATQEAVDKALADLTAAQEALKEKPAPVVKTDLAAAIEAAEKLEEDAYTAETWEAFAEALEAAKAVNEDAAATQEAVDKALADLTAAQEALEEKAAPVVNPFEDVKEADYYYAPVLWAVEKGITTGTSATTFSPEDTCTRGAVVTFLWRAAGCPEPEAKETAFVDITEADYYYKAVLWAVEQGITTGTSATTFAPNDGCTRGQVVTFLFRAAKEEVPADAENAFTDVVEGAYYEDAVLWAVENGITTGTSATTFEPDANCTRGQIVTFIYRA